jgi:plasmid stability protein
MAKTISIRNVPDDTARELAARAATRGQSLQEYLKAHLVDLARLPDPEALVRRIQGRKRTIPSTLTAESILRHLSEDRRQ